MLPGKWLKAGLPYAVAVLGVALITVTIAIVRSRVDLPNVSLVYLLLVLWLGARFGSPPAVIASVLAFVAYDYFFVPPIGQFAVSGPREFLTLVLLLAAALVTGGLAAAGRRSREVAEQAASESRSLYELATAALQLPQAEAGLGLVSDRASQLPFVTDFAVLAVTGDGVEVVAGEPPPADVERQARWAFEHRAPVGIRVAEGAVWPLPAVPAGTSRGLLPLARGVAVIGFTDDARRTTNGRLLGAMISLAGLFLDRWLALREAERLRALEASDSLKSAILSSISHELKSPLAVLRAGLSSMSMPESGLGPQQRELLSGLDNEASRLDRLVGDLLTMSRLEAGVPVESEPGSFAELAGAVLERIRSQLAGRTLSVEVPPELPAVCMDELLTDRVLTNLLENAIEWSRPGTEIRLGAQLADDALRVFVENEGPHIAAADLDAVFDKFWSRRAGGSGLGLAICRRIVEAQGGTIRAQNVHRGPRFSFTVPLAEPARS